MYVNSFNSNSRPISNGPRRHFDLMCNQNGYTHELATIRHETSIFVIISAYCETSTHGIRNTLHFGMVVALLVIVKVAVLYSRTLDARFPSPLILN